MSSAVEIFAAMVRDVIAPALRQLGFRGSGSAFVLPNERSWAIVGLQKSRTSDRGEVGFTVNLTVADKAEWARAREEKAWLPARPSGNSRYPVGTVVRLGSLMPGGRDRWWTVSNPADATVASSAVIAAIRDFGVPWLRARMA